MKILHWYPNFLGGGGVANAVLGLAKAQCELGAEVIIASAEALKSPLYQFMDRNLGKVQLFKWKPTKIFHIGSLIWRILPKSTKKELISLQPDIVHIHGEFNPDNLWVPRFFKVPLILSPHGAFHPIVLRKSKKWQKKLYIELAKRLLYKFVKTFHALCPAEAEHICSALGNVNVYTVPQGYNPFISLKTKLPNKDNQKDIKFIFVGRLDIYTKGLDILIEAFAEVVRKFPDKKLSLVLVGPDWRGSMEVLKQFAIQKGCFEYIIFTGSLPALKVAELVMDADFYIQLSRHEGFPLSIAEALLLGKPAILADTIGTVSYKNIRALPFVRVIPPEQDAAIKAMEEFIRRKDELKAAVQRYREEIIYFFDWHRIAKEHLKQYERIIS